MTSTVDEPLCQLVGVERTYGGPVPVKALQRVDLTLHAGESLAVVGASGSGKSTLLNILGLLDRPDAGEYLVQGVPTTRLREGDRTRLRSQVLGFVFQAFHLLEDRDVLQNVELGMLYAGIRAKDRRRRAAAAVERVGLSQRLRADTRSLSGGERQRVAIARAIAGSSAMLLCDEPTGNLDSTNTRAVIDLLLGLNDDGVTVVVVTHDASVAQRMSRTLTVVDGVVTGTSAMVGAPPAGDTR